METRVIDRSENVADGVESVAPALRHTFGVERRSNTPFITATHPGNSTSSLAKIKPRPSGLFGYVDLD